MTVEELQELAAYVVGDTNFETEESIAELSSKDQFLEAIYNIVNGAYGNFENMKVVRPDVAVRVDEALTQLGVGEA